ncbi:hypothetical protein H6F86_31380 [Phormidium sp. FACHB-592]|uniref:Uncharacterized protein n=1 Tax=Stenomitos frigidus AS-A4 TaxID=2933935 RepID=A0ABV0KRM6_9CYAN|nr:hypothetical protein [Phormidium sp. FACHB-592]MBD2078312.1 hypothetical protein [Phormidium sp. FACHB-592]
MSDPIPNSKSSTEAENKRFPSLESLRTVHSNLLKLHRESKNEPNVLIEIEQFIRKGKATGAVLARENERWSVQSLLDYWSSLLYRAGIEPPDATLADSDLPLVPEPSDAFDDIRIAQSIAGNQNQVIGQVFSGTIISHVENLIQHFHLSPLDISPLTRFWEYWSQETEPSLSPNLVIGGREKERDRIISWLRGSPSPLSLQADSAEESIAFLAAVVENLDDEERTAVLSRAVVVEGATAWQSLIISSDPLILVARLNQPDGIGRAIKSGHHVFMPSGRLGSNDASLLPRIVRDAAEQALKEMGLSPDRARNLATLARRSLSALRRKLAVARHIQQPAWAQANNAQALLSSLLASAWNASYEGDRNALAQLSGIPYEQLQTILVRWANEPDPPVRRVGDLWMIAAQEDAWRLIARYLTDDDLQRFENVAIAILSEFDPAFELPPEQRYAASVYGKVLTRSGRLRTSIAETLALMATLSAEIPFTANKTGEDVTHRITWQLMEKAKYDEGLWASLAPQLPLLAEAAPDVFLRAVDAGLAGETPTLISLFQDQDSEAAFISSSPHTSLLWALETLAWHPDYLSPAALSLARLASLDPGGRLVNRPAKSLRDIFICWHPHTTASLESRLRVLDTIHNREPEVAWHLLLNLLPKHHSAVSPTHGTKWRDWVPDSRTRITVQEYLEATNAILNRLLAAVGTDPTRWCHLIVAASDMTDEQRELLLQHLETFDPQTLSSKERAALCGCLRQESTRHQDFPDADWAMPSEHVQRLEAVRTRFEPDDLVDRYCWLFSYRVELPGMLHGSWEARENVTRGLRTEALQEILRTQSWHGVMKLAEQVNEPALVGKTLAEAELMPIDFGLFLETNLGAAAVWRRQMTQSLVAINAYKRGEPWIEACLSANLNQWRSDQYGDFLLCLPFNSFLLDRLDAAAEEVQHHFWSHTQAANFLDPAQAERVLTQLLKFERPHFAINLLQWALQQTPELFSPERLAEVLERAVRTPPSPDFDASSFAYHSAELLNYLEKTGLERDRLAELEWLYLRVHQHSRRPRILYGELSKNPALFVEALQCIFPAQNESPTEVSDNTKAFALLALDFLESWKQMPGVQDDGSVDGEALRTWVMHARELAAACGRSEVADIYIGQSLAFSPSDPDGMWPHQGVRDLIEELANPDLEDDWQVQILNNRGVTVRMPTDGGEQERALVERYQNDAKQMSNRWPRTAAVLRAIAASYQRSATEHDQQAELTQDFWQ